jgi:hypothetical protein
VTDAAVSASGAGQIRVRTPRDPRPHHPALEELERHRAFIAQLVNPLWARFAEAG